MLLWPRSACTPPPTSPATTLGDRLPQKPAAAQAGYKEIAWEELVPKDWDPMKEFKGIDLSKLSDSDPRANEDAR